MPDLSLFESSTPERFIVGIGAGLAIGIDAEDCACGFEGFGTYAGYFFGVLVVVTVGGGEDLGKNGVEKSG